MNWMDFSSDGSGTQQWLLLMPDLSGLTALLLNLTWTIIKTRLRFGMHNGTSSTSSQPSTRLSIQLTNHATRLIFPSLTCQSLPSQHSLLPLCRLPIFKILTLSSRTSKIDAMPANSYSVCAATTTDGSCWNLEL
jgi:hypothetical protein